MKSFISAVLLCYIVLGVSSGVLPRPRRGKLNQVRSGSYGGSPTQFKNSKDYYRKQSNNPYRRRVVVLPLLDLTLGGAAAAKDDRQELPAKPQHRGSLDLAALFNKNGMFYLTAPGHPDRKGKPLLQKELDQDYISLELLNDKRGYSAYSNKRNRQSLKGLSELISLAKSVKQKQGSQPYSFRPVGYKPKTKTQSEQKHSVGTAREQYVPSYLDSVEPLGSLATGPKLEESRLEDEDYRQEVLAVLRDVKERGAALENQELQNQYLEQPTEFRFEDLVS